MSEIKLKLCLFCGGDAKMKHGFPKQQRKGIRQIEIEFYGLKHRLTERIESCIRDLDEAVGCGDFDTLERTITILQKNVKSLKDLMGHPYEIYCKKVQTDLR